MPKPNHPRTRPIRSTHSPLSHIVVFALGFLLSGILPTKAKVPVVEYRGGDGSSPDRAVIVIADNVLLGSDAELDYLQRHFPSYKFEMSRSIKMAARSLDAYPLTSKRGKKVTVYFDSTACLKDEDPAVAEAKDRFTSDLKKDRRVPTKADVSGSWTCGPNLVGYNMQIEQKAHSVTGRGLTWTDVGISNSFDITGSYRDGVLSLDMIQTTQMHSWHRFIVVQDKDGICLQGLGAGSYEKLVPYNRESSP